MLRTVIVLDTRSFDDSWPLTPALESDQVQVWRVFLDQEDIHVGQLLKLLSADERERAESFRFEQDRTRYIVRRGFLRKLIGCYLSVEPSRIQLHCGPFGKPRVARPLLLRRLHFSVSHSYGIALCAFAWKRRVGIDVEYVRPIPEFEEIAGRFLPREESVVLRALPQSQKLNGFFQLWTRKEAYSKATGQGLACSTDHLARSLGDGSQRRSSGIKGNGYILDQWSFLQFSPASSYFASLCVEGRNWNLVCSESGLELTSSLHPS